MQKQTFTAAIAAAYWGAKVLTNPYKGRPELFVIGDMVGIRPTTLNLHCYDKSGIKWQSATDHLVADCQLILTPLDKISDADLAVIYEIVFGCVIGNLKSWKEGGVIAMAPKGTEGILSEGVLMVYYESLEIIYRENGLENPDTYGALLIWDFLRSKGYDCGYGSIPSLIAAEIAIDGTLNTEK